MTHVEYLEKLLAEYETDVKRYKKEGDFHAATFWEGACFSLNLAIKKLKNGG
jgi:hypothetical protein